MKTRIVTLFLSLDYSCLHECYFIKSFYWSFRSSKMSIVVNSLCRKREIEWWSFVADSLWKRKNDHWSRLTSWLAHWRDRFWSCHWSRLTFDSDLLHSRAYFICWSTQSKDQSLSAFVANLLLNMSLKQTHYQVTDLMMKSILNASLKQTHCWFVSTTRM